VQCRWGVVALPVVQSTTLGQQTPLGWNSPCFSHRSIDYARPNFPAIRNLSPTLYWTPLISWPVSYSLIYSAMRHSAWRVLHLGKHENHEIADSAGHATSWMADLAHIKMDSVQIAAHVDHHAPRVELRYAQSCKFSQVQWLILQYLEGQLVDRIVPQPGCFDGSCEGFRQLFADL
jgi:hypothetical protein